MKENSDSREKTIWFRIGMEAKLSQLEYESLMKAYEEGDSSKIEDFFRILNKRGELSGESYIVGKSNGGVDDYDNPESEISVLF